MQNTYEGELFPSAQVLLHVLPKFLFLIPHNVHTITGFNQILHIDTLESILLQKLRCHTVPVHQCSSKRAIIPLFNAAAETSRLQHNQVRLLMHGNLPTFRYTIKEPSIYDPPISCSDQTSLFSAGTRGVRRLSICFGQTMTTS